jgi:hypothetical protein
MTNRHSLFLEADVDVVGVDPGRGAGVSTDRFPRAALRTGRAPRRRIRLSTSPAGTPLVGAHAVLGHGVGIFEPR